MLADAPEQPATHDRLPQLNVLPWHADRLLHWTSQAADDEQIIVAP